MAYLLPLVEKRLEEHRGEFDTPEEEVRSTSAEQFQNMALTHS